MSNTDMPEWEKEFKRAKNNAIYFLEKYYNVSNPDKKVTLTDEEKQNFFDKYKGVPLMSDFKSVIKYTKRIEELREKGYKDWEMF